ncbi:MAG TPA: hypothetical protein VMF06_02960 [Candidatus Limnocylindria bacterium]|jgi:hypothetical protein|nr:hypothetical protein [Candidatus Limnocylindria bacterium]
MKRVIPAVSLLTLGAASVAIPAVVHAAEGGISPWKLSATVDAFYDNNAYGRSGIIIGTNGFSQTARKGSFGFEFSPGFSVSTPIGDGSTTVGVSYRYNLRYYDERESHVSHQHFATANLKHKFNDTVNLALSDEFSYSQDPGQNAPGGAAYRTTGDNLYNVANLGVGIQVAPLWVVDVTYQNTLVHFQDVNLRDVLDRMEHLPGIDARYRWSETASVLLAYQYRIVRYDGVTAFGKAHAQYSDLSEQKVFAGIDNDWLPTFRTSLRAGIGALSYENHDNIVDRDGILPYVDANATWDYLTDSSVTIGVRRDWAASDVAVGGTDPSRGKQLTTVFLSNTYSFTPDAKLIAGGGYQWGELIGGGSLNGKNEDYAYINVEFRYRFTPNITGFAAYNFDVLTSSKEVNATPAYFGRDFDRSVVKVGAIFTY